MLLFAVHKWPHMLSMALRPYALCTVNEVCNSTTLLDQQRTPIEFLTQVNIAPKLQHFHIFSCPTYILDNKLQERKAIQKWQSHSHLGIYLGPSPNNSCSVSFILKPCTGHTSPQYHVIILQWKTQQLEFIMAFPQAPIQTPLYMNIPKGCKIPRDQQNHPMVLKLLHNIYG